MRPLAMLLVLAVLAVGAAGCGGGSNSAAETTTTAASTTETTSTTEATETETAMQSESTTTEASGFDFGSGDCRKLALAAAQVSQSLSAASTDKEKLEQAKQLYQSFVDKAPADIKPDLQVLADAYSKVVDAVGNLNLKPGETPDAATIQKVQQALASIDNAKVQQASQHVTSWVKSNCGTSGG